MTQQPAPWGAPGGFLIVTLILALPGMAWAGLIDFSWVPGQQQVATTP